jgi:hypothetical protein
MKNKYMKTEFKDFIGIFHDVATKEECNKIIEHFNNVDDLNLTVSRKEFEKINSIFKDNKIYYMVNENDSLLTCVNQNILKGFINNLSKVYEIYKKKYDVMNNLGMHKLNSDVKIQKTIPGEGYHVWHCENATVDSSRKVLLCMMYLNDIKEGGETEFLYQSLRIPPKAGTIVICPAYFTHTHRGNPPLKGIKYMINGWIEFIN